jgi:hypothetical protein
VWPSAAFVALTSLGTPDEDVTVFAYVAVNEAASFPDVSWIARLVASGSLAGAVYSTETESPDSIREFRFSSTVLPLTETLDTA